MFDNYTEPGERKFQANPFVSQHSSDTTRMAGDRMQEAMNSAPNFSTGQRARNDFQQVLQDHHVKNPVSVAKKGKRNLYS